MASPGVELQTLRECQDRALHREGIPIFVALVDERKDGNVPAPSQQDANAGKAVAARLSHYHRTLGPSRRDTDMGVVVSVLTVAAYEDFDRSVTP